MVGPSGEHVDQWKSALEFANFVTDIENSLAAIHPQMLAVQSVRSVLAGKAGVGTVDGFALCRIVKTICNETNQENLFVSKFLMHLMQALTVGCHIGFWWACAMGLKSTNQIFSTVLASLDGSENGLTQLQGWPQPSWSICHYKTWLSSCHSFLIATLQA